MVRQKNSLVELEESMRGFSSEVLGRCFFYPFSIGNDIYMQPYTARHSI